MREESRGAYYREDYPETDEGWTKYVHYARNEDGSMRLWTAPIRELPEEVRAELERRRELDYHYLE